MDPEPAKPEDVAEILTLLREAQLPVEGVEAALGGFFVVRESGRVVGAAGLEVHGQTGLLRSVAVAPAHRNRGFAGRLVEHVLERAASQGMAEVYLLTISAAEFFRRLAFRPVPRQDAPPEVRGTAEFREQCPATAGLMRRELSRSPGRLR
jgi:amino-acid N-acetyltransferase